MVAVAVVAAVAVAEDIASVVMTVLAGMAYVLPVVDVGVAGTKALYTGGPTFFDGSKGWGTWQPMPT